MIQLWHAPGAFKKFGASSDNKSRNILGKISRNIDYLITSSDNIEEYYSEAFQINKSKIKSLVFQVQIITLKIIIWIN